MKYPMALVACTLVFFSAGCGDDGTQEVDCEASTLTYDNFGSAFMTNYCNDCHSATATDRQNAPVSVNFDTQMEVQNQKDRVDGRAGQRSSMPPLTFQSQPSDSERTMLSEWTYCGAN